MSFDNLFKPEVLNFIKTNENIDIVKLIFKGSPFEEIDIQSIVQQIKGRQIAKNKFPDLYQLDYIIYPPKLNLEQASSQTLADYKAKFIKKNESIIDITGGFGIDCMAFSKKTENVFYCEINPKTYKYANHNFTVLDKSINPYLGNGIDYLNQIEEKYDWIFIDPSRRNEHAQKVFLLEDCAPNILEHLELFKSKSKRLLIKISPLLDLKYCITKIKYITDIHIVANQSEVKELLLLVDFKNIITNPIVHAVNLSSSDSKFSAEYRNISLKPKISEPLTYLYEPNSAIMKSGLFGELSKQYSVSALDQHSHLFTSEKLLAFPGRRFEIIKVISPKIKLIKKHIPDSKANISSRNFPLKPEQIKAKYKLKDGGAIYTFFTTNLENKKIVLICKKI